MQRELGKESRGGPLESSIYDSLLIRGVRVIHKIQQRNPDAFKDASDVVITNEILKDVAENVL